MGELSAERRLDELDIASERTLVKEAQIYLDETRNHHAVSPGHTQAWKAFFDHFDRCIRRFANTCGVDRGMLDDVVQQVWLDLMLELPSFNIDDTRARFPTWLYSVVHNKVVDSKRSQVRHPTCKLESLESSPRGQYRDPTPCCGGAGPVGQAMRRLPPRDTLVLYLLDMKGLSVKEIADQLGVSSEQVWTYHHRAKSHMRQLLATMPKSQTTELKSCLGCCHLRECTSRIIDSIEQTQTRRHVHACTPTARTLATV